MPPKFWEDIVILCVERQYNKIALFAQNQTFWPPPKFLGWLHCCEALINAATTTLQNNVM